MLRIRVVLPKVGGEVALFFDYPKSHVAQSRTDHLFSSRADRLPRPPTDQKVEVLPP